LAFCGDFIRIQYPRWRYRQVFSQGRIAVEDLVDFEDRAVHLPKGIRELLFVCHEFSRRRACYALMLQNLVLGRTCDACVGEAATMVSYGVENIGLMDHECDEERAEG
jgi:hypothetical protein